MSEEKKGASFANKAYAAAEKALREAHLDEFEALLQAEYDKAGVTRIKKRTAEQIAADKAAAVEAREAAKAAKAREKALAAAQALALEYPDLVQVTPTAPLTDDQIDDALVV